MLTVRVKINIASQTTPQIIPVVQGDTGRSVLFEIADFVIPASATATYYIKKPSGQAVYNAATIDGNTVLADLTAQSIAEVGENPGQVRILKNDEVVTSFDFILDVEPFRGIDAIESTTEMNVFDQAVQQALEEIDGSLDSIVADEFSTSDSYLEGEYVMKDGALYRFTSNHAAGAWSTSDTEAVTIGEALTELAEGGGGGGAVNSVNGKTGTVVLDAGDLEYDDEETYSSNTVGKALTDLKSDITNIQNATLITDTASGAIASFPDGANGVPVKDLSVAIEPVQDLHGQSNPYPAGGWKNKFVCDAFSFTHESVAYAYDPETNTLTKSGTSSGAGGYNVATITVPAGTYTFSAKFTAETGNATNIYLRDTTTNENVGSISKNSGYLTTYLDGSYYVRLSTGAGETGGSISEIQLESGSSVTSYAPPSNICPISGWTQAKVTQTGKNLLNPDILTTMGTTYVTSVNYNTEGKISVKPSTQYVFSFSGTVGDGRIFQYDASGNAIGSALQFTSQPYSFTTDASCTKIGFRYKFTETSGATVADSKAQLEKGSTATAYEPYSGQTYTIDLDGTIYGGTLDVTTGVLTVDRAIMDLGTIPESSWRYNHASSGAFDTSAIASLVKNNNCICSNYKTLESPTGTNISANDYFVAINKKDDGTAYSGNYGIGTLVVKDTNYTDVSTFVTGMSGVKLCYKLATPFTVQLTAQDNITTLLGQNNIWSDTGNTTIEYYADTKLYINKVLNA